MYSIASQDHPAVKEFELSHFILIEKDNLSKSFFVLSSRLTCPSLFLYFLLACWRNLSPEVKQWSGKLKLFVYIHMKQMCARDGR